MKKSILILSAAFALVGCKPQGGTSDQYSTDTGTTVSTNMRSTSSLTNYSTPDVNSQGAASSQGGTNTGAASSSTNSPLPSKP
jgi:hypothetical protein